MSEDLTVSECVSRTRSLMADADIYLDKGDHENAYQALSNAAIWALVAHHTAD